jgi:hypothetical protein
MGDTGTYIDAPPEEVFDKLTKPIDDVEPGIIGGLLEGRSERKMLEELKKMVEAK